MADKRNKDEQELQNIFEDKRFFIFEDEKYYIDAPSVDDARSADWLYSRTYNEALLAGVATEAQMETILEERGILGPAYEKKKGELLAELDTKVAELGAAKSIAEKKELADEVEAVRLRLYKWNQRQSSPMSVTCEQMSNDARIEGLTSAMVKDSKGNRVWRDYEDYKTTDRTTLAYMARYNTMLSINGLQQDFLSQTPEAIARRQIEEDEQRLLTTETPDEEFAEKVEEKSPRKKK